MEQIVPRRYMAYRRDGFPSGRAQSGYLETKRGFELTRTEVQAVMYKLEDFRRMRKAKGSVWNRSSTQTNWARTHKEKKERGSWK